jgi:hypothetical protein
VDRAGAGGYGLALRPASRSTARTSRPDFIRLDLPQLDPSGLDQVLVHAPTLPPGPRPPARDGPFVQPNAATFAWTGHPDASSVTTVTTSARAVRSRCSAVPTVSANVRRHRLHRYRRSARLWITTCPSPFRP